MSLPQHADTSEAPDSSVATEAEVGEAATSVPRLGFLGVGWIGRQRMSRILESGAARATAIVDTSPEMIEAALSEAPDAVVATSLEELLDMSLDGLVIATPSAMHAEQSIAALEKGLAVFCQKPLGRTAAETARVVDTAARVDRLLEVDLSYRYTAAFQRVKEVIESGRIGRVFAVDLVFHNAYGPDKDWFYDPQLAGGGCVMDLGVHLVDMVQWILGFPPVTEVSSRRFTGGSPATSAEVEDFAHARLDLAGGVIVTLACSWKVSAGQDAVIGATFYGTAGAAVVHNVNGSFFDFVAERHIGTAREGLAEPPDDWGGRAAVSWASKLAQGARFDPAAGELIAVAEILDRIYGR